MIHVPFSVLADCHSLFRRASPKRAGKPAANIVVRGGRDGIRIAFVQNDIALAYHHPGPAESVSFSLPLAALAELPKRGTTEVHFQPGTNGTVKMYWEHAGSSCQREYATTDTSSAPLPTQAEKEIANEPGLLAALVQAMQIPSNTSARLSLHCIQLRGNRRDIVATDGKQLLIQGGFAFPWRDALLLPCTNLFAAKELPQGETVHVSRNQSHVMFRIGTWTLGLPIAKEEKYPNVDQVIPRLDEAATHCQIAEDEVSKVLAMLDNLPSSGEEDASLTMDLDREVILRTKSSQESHCTELELPGSMFRGQAMRVATHRRYLQRALQLGIRAFHFTAADKPVLAQARHCTFVWLPLPSETALGPQADTRRTILPLRTLPRSAVRETPQSTENPTLPMPPPRQPRHGVAGLAASLGSLWRLVRHHHQAETMQ